jgi:hypothetical protein
VAILEQDLVVRHVGEDAAPWVDTGMGVELKLMRFDTARGTWVIRNRFAPGVQLQRHRHTGPVEGYTLSGRWHYLEYDFMSTAGSYIYEPANSVHTLQCVEDGTRVWFHMLGMNLNLDAEGRIESVSDGAGTLAFYLALCEQQGLPRPPVLVD